MCNSRKGQARINGYQLAGNCGWCLVIATSNTPSHPSRMPGYTCSKRIWWRATSTKGDVLALPDPSVGLQWLRPPDRAPKQPAPLPWPALTVRDDFDRGLPWASTATPCVQFTPRSWERTPALAVGKEEPILAGVNGGSVNRICDQKPMCNFRDSLAIRGSSSRDSHTSAAAD